MSELLALPEPLSGLLNWMMRQGQVTLSQVTAFLHQGEEHTRALLADLDDKGYVHAAEIRGVMQYSVRMAPRHGRTLPADLWQALEEQVE